MRLLNHTEILFKSTNAKKTGSFGECEVNLFVSLWLLLDLYSEELHGGKPWISRAARQNKIKSVLSRMTTGVPKECWSC